MRDSVAALALGLVIGVAAVPGGSAQAVEPGTTVDQSNVDQVKDMLPPEIYSHFKKGEYANKLVDFPNSRWSWDDGFSEAMKWNAEHLVLDDHKAPVDKTTGKRPDYIRGLPFPDIREDDPEAGYKALWNLDYAYYTGGNSHNWTALNWVSRSGVDRSSVQDVYFLYYDGQPQKYSPKSNPQNFLFQFLAVSMTPADLQGTAALGYRYKDPTKRDLSWAYVPALRRVRAVSPANRSDGFLGSDQSQDDGFVFDGKPEDFDWKIVGHKEGLRFVDPDSIAGKSERKPLPGGGWRSIFSNNDRTIGYMVKDWKGVPWAPAAAGLAKRKFWVLEGVPKDRYYLYGKLELWIDDQTWQGAWNRKFSWRGGLLDRYAVTRDATPPVHEHQRGGGGTLALPPSENNNAGRAPAAGPDGP